MAKSFAHVEKLESRQLLSGVVASNGVADLSHTPAIHRDVAALPKVFGIDATTLSKTKAAVSNSKSALQPAIKSLISSANTDLKMTPVAVTDKTPPSGISAHDYVSYAKYYWPNPNTKTGLPFIHEDGHDDTAQTAKGDLSEIDKMVSAVNTLGIAYYLTGTASYAKQAARMLEVWFLNSATKMSPNMDHAQMVLGVNTGTSTGILDFRNIGQVIDAIGLISTSSYWTKSDASGMTAWFTSYNIWLHDSGAAKAESAATNNTGTWFDVQQMSVLLFLGKTSEATALAKTFETKRINTQITSSGSQPLELARADGFSYSLFNLDAMVEMATLADRVGVDLWTYTGKAGGSIKKAIDYVAPYADASKKWPHNQLNALNRSSLIPILIQAKNVYGGSTYTKFLADFSASSVTANAENLYSAT